MKACARKEIKKLSISKFKPFPYDCEFVYHSSEFISKLVVTGKGKKVRILRVIIINS